MNMPYKIHHLHQGNTQFLIILFLEVRSVISPCPVSLIRGIILSKIESVRSKAEKKIPSNENCISISVSEAL